jgi:tetratricopeptide (TPR) repeat protein
MLLVEQATNFTATRLAYRRYIGEFSPDDFTTVASGWSRHVAEMTCREIIAFIRFTHFDAHQFAKTLDRLAALAPEMRPDERREVSEAVERVWDMYYSLGEEPDLAFRLGSLLYSLGEYARAIVFFQRSIEIYGDYTGTLLNLGACHLMLGDHAQARRTAEQVLQAQPNNPAAVDLLEQCHPD